MADTVSFKVPSSPSKSVLTIDNFLGADFTNSPANIDLSRSPNCVNMIRDVPGKIRKCMGYETIETFDGQINGVFYLTGSTDVLVHAGTKFYLYAEDETITELYAGANNKRSKAFQFEDKLYILDGLALLVFDGSTVVTAASIATIPTVTIGKSPSGGGTSYYGLNLLQPGFTELFLSDGTSTAYQLSFSGLDDTAVVVKQLNANGEWDVKTEGTDFTVNRTSGIINFTAAPSTSPVTGQDNISITAYRTISGYADRINHCDIGIMYGVNGASDRLFVSGNSDYRNYDWFSAQYDPTYFADTSYATLGSKASAIMGYSIISNYLATHKDEMETDKNIIIREGDLVDSEPAFKIINTLQGPGAIAKGSFNYLATEPLFLTRLGVYAVTAQDVTGEKYSQNRSFYLNGKLLEENNLEDAFSFVYKDMYWLCINNVAYILDGLQPVQTDKSLPYATRQYAGFYRTNIPATTMWKHDGRFYFGTADGKINRFFANVHDLDSYNDNGEAITAIWETPDIDGKLFYKNKTFRYIATRLQAEVATSLYIYAMKRGIWSQIKYDDLKGRYLSFVQLIFSKFTFSSDQTQHVIPTKCRIKKVDKARFRFMNTALNEPFGIFDLAFEYVENGNYKG